MNGYLRKQVINNGIFFYGFTTLPLIAKFPVVLKITNSATRKSSEVLSFVPIKITRPAIKSNK